MELKRHKINIFGAEVDDISQKEAISRLVSLSKSKKRGNYAVTVNSEFVMLGRRNKEFLRIINGADLALADGWWVANTRLILGGKEQKPFSGVDILEKLCEKCAEKAITVGFLGGFKEVAKQVSVRQKEKYPSLIVKIAEPGDPTTGYDLRLKSKISAVGGVDVLFVAYGMGKQEFWINRVKKMLDVGLFIGVGGAFDYVSGVKMRAPKLVQNAGFEWLWRLFWEPARIWRQRVLLGYFLMFLPKFLKFLVSGGKSS